VKHGLRVLLALLMVGLLTGCTAPFLAALQSAMIDDCALDEIQFTQATGCLNDGSFEFCLANDATLIAEIEQMSPNIACGRGRGRAQCDLETEVLCSVSTDNLCLEPDSYVMSAAGWRLTCAIAAHPAVDELVPTWYE
jgi:hypothetical protein